MDTFLIISALVLCILGIMGCVAPAVPGPPLNFIAMLLMQWAIEPFRLRTLIIWTIVTIVVVVVDYLIPIWTAHKFGATKQGIRGAIIGMLAGMFFTPIGMIAGLIIGSIIGDLMARRTLAQASRAAAGSLFGTLFTIGLKLVVAGWMTFLVVYRAGQHFLN